MYSEAPLINMQLPFDVLTIVVILFLSDEKGNLNPPSGTCSFLSFL